MHFSPYFFPTHFLSLHFSLRHSLFFLQGKPGNCLYVITLFGLQSESSSSISKQIELVIDEDVHNDNLSYNDEYDMNIDIICNIMSKRAILTDSAPAFFITFK